MAVLKRRKKTANLSYLASGVAGLAPERLLEEAGRLGVKTTPLDVAALASALGINLKSYPMSDDVSGHLCLSNGKWEISINSLHHPKRQRFTLAHELGHYILHRWRCQNFEDKKLFRNTDSNPMEAEANEYAANLMMPENEFRTFVQTRSSKINDLADHFDVSAIAVRVRAKKLGYTGHGLD